MPIITVASECAYVLLLGVLHTGMLVPVQTDTAPQNQPKGSVIGSLIVDFISSLKLQHTQAVDELPKLRFAVFETVDDCEPGQ